MIQDHHAVVLVNRIPYPLEDGWRVRTYHMIRAVAERGTATVLSFGADKDRPVAEALEAALGQRVTVTLVPPVSRFAPWRLAAGMLGNDPFLAVAERSREFRQALARELESRHADLILCETVAMFDQLRDLPVRPFTVIDTHNIDSLVFGRYARSMPTWHKRWYAGVTARKLLEYERRAFRQASAVVVCSGIERESLQESHPGLNPWVVPNGADLDRFEPQPAIARVPGRIFFFGRLDYHPNRDAIEFFLQEIFPLVREAEPMAEFHVAGAGLTDGLARALAGVPHVVLHGKVEDLGALLATASVVAVPLRAGGGTRLKILEALAAASPVVSTTVGAEGLDLVSGADLLLADDPTAFAGAVIELLRGPGKAAALGASGGRAVWERYDWRAIEKAFRSSINSLIGARPGGP